MAECREEPFPGIIVKGALQDCKVAIIAEKQVLCEFSGGLVDATIGYMAAHYVFMFKYACSLSNFCLFCKNVFCKFKIARGCYHLQLFRLLTS